MAERRTLDKAEQKWLQERWYKIDTSGDGTLDHHELGKFMDSLHTGMSDTQKIQAFHEIDHDETGSVEVLNMPAPLPLYRWTCLTNSSVCWSCC